MESKALENVADALEEVGAKGSFCVRQTTSLEDLIIEVKGHGVLRLPLKQRTIKALIKQAQPAKFGWRDQTKLDPKVRDVWEIPKRQIKIDNRRWNKTLKPTLEQLKSALGLTNQDKLKAQLHNALIYEPGQFFKPHQDSEKCDGMVATLVVVLPSPYRGGTLVVDHQGEKQRFPSTKTPKDKLTFIAFYADCHHEVRPVTEGYRVALTYNLVLDGANKTIHAPSTDQSDAAVTQAVANYFDQSFDPRPEYYRNQTELKKLIYLLDYEYTPKGLSWKNLKSADRTRSQALMKAAEVLGLEVHLALADIHETWECEDEYEYRGYGGRRRQYWGYDDDEEDEDNENTEEGVTLTELVSDEASIRHWVNDADKAVQLPDLSVERWQMCWTKAMNDFKPFESEYEGYMGNYGNTMDHWYHRAAVILWRQADHYATLLQFNPDKVIAEVLQLTQKTSTLPQAQQIVQNFISHWTGLWDSAKPSEYSRILKLAAKLNQKKLAEALLDPLGVSALCSETVDALMLLEKTYGMKWCLDTVKKWVLPQSKAFFHRPQRIDKISKITERLVTKYNTRHQKLSQWLLSYQFDVLKEQHLAKQQHAQLAVLQESAPSRMRDVMDLLQASFLTLDEKIHNTVLDFLMANEALYPVLELQGLLQKFYKEYQHPEVAKWHHTKLYQCVKKKLTTEVKRGPRQPGDWSILDRNICTCDECEVLNVFLQNRQLTQKVWPLNKGRRWHIHGVINGMCLPVTHQTEHTGSPHKLVLKKTKQLFIQDKVKQTKYRQALDKLSVL